MTTWIVKSEIDDLRRGLEMVEQQRSDGYKAWIEDENGRKVDEASLKKNDTTSTKCSAYETVMAVLIWGAAAIIGVGALYALSFLAGD
jgi:hypothetical protein